MTLSIGISESNRDSIVKILNAVLADEYVLYTKTRNYHWNVVGPQFNDLHKFFEGQYEALNEVVDGVAEWADLETVMEKHNDAGTSDFLTGLMEKHEKMAWMLRAFSEK